MANFLLLTFLHIVYCISFFLQAVYAFFILYLIFFFVFRSFFFVGRGMVSRHALQAEVNSGAPFATCIFCIFAFCTLYFFLSFIIFLGLVSRHALEAEVSRAREPPFATCGVRSLRRFSTVYNQRASTTGSSGCWIEKLQYLSDFLKYQATYNLMKRIGWGKMLQCALQG